MKTTFPKTKPRKIFFRDYKYFYDIIFKKLNLDKSFLETTNTLMTSFLRSIYHCLDATPHAYINFREFQKLFLRVFYTHAPSKLKYVRANEVPYIYI